MEINSSFWSQIKSSMKTKNGTNKLLENWLDPIDLIRTEKNEGALKITLGVPNQFFFFYVNEHLKDKIALELSAISNLPTVVEFIVTGKVADDYNTSLQDIMQNADQVFQTPPTSAAVAPKLYENINSDFTFSTFVVGKNSEFAHAAPIMCPETQALMITTLCSFTGRQEWEKPT